MYDFLEIVGKLGSVNITAVAGRFLGSENEPGILDEKIATAVDPGIPATSENTSAAITSLWKKYSNKVKISINTSTMITLH